MSQTNILITVDSRYLPHVQIMLSSIFINNPGCSYNFYLIHADIPASCLSPLQILCERNNSRLLPVKVPEHIFNDAPTGRYYSKAMYYRLLAHEFLPEHLEKILYLDPDILVINPLEQLYNLDMGDNLFAAAEHTWVPALSKYINMLRLGNYESGGYFNSGVMLLNLARQRREMDRAEIFDYVRRHWRELILPDQDVLNALYGHRILPLDDSLYNYDARLYQMYYLASGGEKDLGWVMENTAIIHFCGKTKPWLKNTKGKFAALYKHYMRLSSRNFCAT
ncbi:MAG: glycosyltransferase family 8 protein [Desulfovibrionaceae bacterium]|nr:glycosyltransferase family 8 protein [Desulfovibrionaceae bacterium]